MSDFTLCPECLRPGVQEISRAELMDRSRRAGVRWIRPLRRRQVAGYWWCDRCGTGGAFLEWIVHRRGA